MSNPKTVYTYATMHDVIFVPEVGQFGPTLSSEATSIHKPIKMTDMGGEVELEVSNKFGKKFVLIVPKSNFKVLVPQT